MALGLKHFEQKPWIQKLEAVYQAVFTLEAYRSLLLNLLPFTLN